MNAGETTKYFKYAIGEIILVMIGILLALQVNNWNESRKARAKEVNLFNNLIIDFESRFNELEEFNKAREIALASILKLNNIIAGAVEKPDATSLDNLLVPLLNGLKFNEEFEMLGVVFNTGLINDIKSEELKRALIEWPQKVEEMLEEQRMINQLIDSEIVPFLSQYVSIREIYEKFDFRKYNLPKGGPVTMIENYKALLSDPKFENYLARQEMLIRITMIDTDILLASAEEIIELLKEDSQ
jgi:hypothetical protein